MCQIKCEWMCGVNIKTILPSETFFFFFFPSFRCFHSGFKCRLRTHSWWFYSGSEPSWSRVSSGPSLTNSTTCWWRRPIGAQSSSPVKVEWERKDVGAARWNWDTESSSFFFCLHVCLHSLSRKLPALFLLTSHRSWQHVRIDQSVIG